MATELLFRDDAYLKTASARVVAAGDGWIELDRTIFYPLGGGQPGDTGHLVRENGERIKRALSFLASSKDIEIAWFEAKDGEPENIRVADDVIIDLLFAANGETYDSVQADVREIEIEGVRVRVLNIDGLLKTKTRTREKDILDRSMLEKIKRDIGDGH